MIDVQSYVSGKWIPAGPQATQIESAVSGRTIAKCGGAELDFEAMLQHARSVGGPALRAMTFHDRARLLKALATHLNENKDGLYDLSYDTGGTLKDHRIDIDGGIGTMFVFASKGRRELPDSKVALDGDLEQLSRNGTFVGQHILVPLQGVGIHINAFNFPVWGMLEKLAPCLLAGVPAIVKPATATSYVAQACFKLMIESEILPEGAVQMICGSTGDLLDHLTGQDVVSFTGSAATASKLKAHPVLQANATRFVAEQDSLNGAMLGPDAAPGSPEAELFLDEAVNEITAKAGQKCTAMRRLFVPLEHIDALSNALTERLAEIRLGNPRHPDVDMGALVSANQKQDVLSRLKLLKQEANVITLTRETAELLGDDVCDNAIIAPVLL